MRQVSCRLPLNMVAERRMIDAHIGGVNGLREADVDGGDEHAVKRRWVDGLVKAELQKVYDGILVMMDKNIIHSESTGESQVFDFKVKGGRYGFEFATGDAESKAVENARVAHAEDTDRLDLMLDFSVHQHEVIRIQTRRARWHMLPQRMRSWSRTTWTTQRFRVCLLSYSLVWVLSLTHLSR